MAKTTYNNKNYGNFDINSTMFYGFDLDEYQKQYRDYIWDKDHIVVICEAKAGTGKTQIAVATANLLVQTGRYDKIIFVTFPCNEEKQGLLPGTLEEKSAPYFEPLRQALVKCNVDPEQVFDTNFDALKKGTAYIHPVTHTYLRGVNFENAVVILEECQNGYVDEIRKVLTRCAENCKVILIGNDRQCDLLKNKANSGFAKYREFFAEHGEGKVAFCKLEKNYRGWLANLADEI